MQTPWSFTQNQFDNATKLNVNKMLLLSRFHFNAISALAGNAFFDGLIASYTPIHQAFEDEFALHESALIGQTGATKSFDDLLADLKATKADAWDTLVKVVYAKGTAQYIAIMGHLHNEMQSGKKDDRVNAVNTLITNIGADASLAALKTEVQAFYVSLIAARTAQQGKLSGTKTESDNLETKRVNCADGQYGNLGLLMNHFATDREQIDNFFDLVNLRNHNQTTYTVTLPAHSSKTILKHRFGAGDKIIVLNPADSENVLLCLQHDDNGSCSSGTNNPAGVTTTIDVDNSFGNLTQDKFLTATNNTDGEAHFTLTVNF